MTLTQLPGPESVPSLGALSRIVDALGLFFLSLDDRAQLAGSGGTIVVAAEYELDGTPVVGFKFCADKGVADVSEALETAALMPV